jgi:hypothetical protein
MKLSLTPKNRLLIAVKQSKFFFSGCFSMHIMPVLFALFFIVLAEKRMMTDKYVSNVPVKAGSSTLATSPDRDSEVPFSQLSINYALSSVSACNAKHVTLLYKIGYLVSYIVR